MKTGREEANKHGAALLRGPIESCKMSQGTQGERTKLHIHDFYSEKHSSGRLSQPVTHRKRRIGECTLHYPLLNDQLKTCMLSGHLFGGCFYNYF